MPNKPLSSNQQLKIVLKLLIGGFTSTASAAQVGAEYNISGRAALALRDKALQAIKNTFTANPSVAIPDLDGKIDALIAEIDSGEETEEYDDDEGEINCNPITTGEVVDKIIKWNNNTEHEPKLYISENLAHRFSGESRARVKIWFDKHRMTIAKHHQEHELDSNSNKGMKNFDWRNVLDD